MNYASAKGMPREFANVRFIRNRDREYAGPFKKRRQVVFKGFEDYVFIPERIGYSLSGGSGIVQHEVMGSRPVYKIIVHRA